MVTRENSCEILANEAYKMLYAYHESEGVNLYTEPQDGKTLAFMLPNITAKQLGSAEFKKAYGTKYAYCGGAMANAIASSDMVIALGKCGCVGSFGAGGLSVERVAQEIDKIQTALCNGEPYMVNMLSSRNNDAELKLAQMLIDKNVPAVEASAFIIPSEALVYYRIKGIKKNEDGTIVIPRKVMAKISREEVLQKFVSPADAKTLKNLLKKGLITEEEAELATKIPVADDITVEADSGGHTDGRPLVSMLPALITVANQLQEKYNYATKVRIGAGGGIGSGTSCLAAFQMGAAYVVGGSVHQSCVESGTSAYVKELLAQTAMADVTMAPCADMFETGAKVEIIKKGTSYAQNAQKMYDYYTKYPSFEAIPEADRKRIETRMLKMSFEEVWTSTKEYFEKVNPTQIKMAESNPKHKMALVFRWYLGQSSRWAVQDVVDRRADMQIWCGQSMGAFNIWVKETPFEKPENRRVGEIAKLMLDSAAYQYMYNMCTMAGVSSESLKKDIL